MVACCNNHFTRKVLKIQRANERQTVYLKLVIKSPKELLNSRTETKESNISTTQPRFEISNDRMQYVIRGSSSRIIKY